MSIGELCRSGLDDRSFRQEVLADVRRTVAFDAHVWLLTDPATEVGTSPLADVGPAFAELPRLIRSKYATALDRWTTLDPPVATLQRSTDGRPDRSLVWRECLRVHGVHDVASIVFRDEHGCWSFLDLWRTGRAFSPSEAAHLARHVPEITSALRRRTLEALTPSTDTDQGTGVAGPSVLVLSADLDVKGRTPGTDPQLRVLLPPDAGRDPVPAAAYNVAAQLLAVEAGVDGHEPAARVHLHQGRWVTLRAARLGGDIAVGIERTGATERCDLLARAAALTPRETELVGRLVVGADTRALAQQMHVSPHTIQDHLKSVFAKTGATSRRDLVARAVGG